MKKHILFVVGSATAYRIHQPFAAFCVQQGRKVSFLYDREPDPLFETIVSDARALGATAASVDAAITAGPHQAPWSMFNRAPARARIFNTVREQSTGARMKAFSDVIFSRLAAAEGLIKKINPAIVIVAEDGVAGPLAVIAAAQRKGIPVAILPYGYGTQQDFDVALEAKAAAGELEQPTGPEGDAIRQHAPEWIKTDAFAGSLLFPAEYIVALESAGIHLRNAWTVHGGTAECLLVESEQMRDLYRSEAVANEKLVLTGTPYGDFVRASLDADPAARAAFRQPRKIDAAETRILVSWPPSYHAVRGPKSEFDTYEAMTKALLTDLAAIAGARLVVSLHPAVSADDRKAIAALGVTLTDEYVLGLIPRHDIYVSYFSSTIRWAIACGKPVINYDAYKLSLDVYDAAPGVLTTESAERVRNLATEWVTSAAAFETAASAQCAVAPRWGAVEAPAMPRILQTLDGMRA